jgi:CheY-like chemotaxis protein
MNLIDHRPILIVEDSDEDFAATLWALEKASIKIPIVRCKDGELAIDYLEKRGNFAASEAPPLPAIILLDLNLPRTNGHQVLKHIKTSNRLKILPVIVFSSSKASEDIRSCYQNGSNSYLAKPIGIAELRKLMNDLAEYWFRLSLLPDLKAMNED